jgi:1,2-diacylglycerol 3-alpha-glucosyltransferase
MRTTFMTRRMKIVMLCDLYVEELRYQENLLAKYYRKHGHDVTIVASTFRNAFDYEADRYDPRIPASQTWDGDVKVIRLPYALNVLNRLRRFAGIGELLDREKPDLIFVHDIHLNLAEAARYKRDHPGCRVILDYHADYANSAKNWLSLNVLHRLIRRRFFHRYRRFVDRIYPVVPGSRVFLNEVYGVPYEEMEILPLGADSDAAKSVIDSRVGAVIRADLAIPDDAVVVFTGGKLTPSKQTHLLLEAVASLQDPTLHVLVVGDAGPEHRPYKRRLVDQCRDNPRVHFVGWVSSEDVYAYMNAADFAVFPASQSVLWQQALSMGLPLIVGSGTHRGDQDPSYMNLYDNLIVLPRAQIRSDVIGRELAALARDRSRLRTAQAGARRLADEMLDYNKIVLKTLATGPSFEAQ